MQEIEMLYAEMKKIEFESMKLNMADPKRAIPMATLFLAFGIMTKSAPLIIASLFLGGYSSARLLSGDDIESLKIENEKAHFDKATQIHYSVRRSIRIAFDGLKNENNPKKRAEILDTIQWMKRIDTIRQADKKEVMLLWGQKRKSLARGLKNLRRQVGTMSKEEYIRRRENILSYY